MKEAFIEKRFTSEITDLIEQANAILEESMADGFPMTVRQLYYQLVSRGVIPNSQKSYKRVVSFTGDARKAGLIDWDAIEARTRGVKKSPTWSGPASILRAAAGQYARDWWRGQGMRMEVWIEKDALAGIFDQACRRHQIPLMSCRGYTSLTEMKGVAERIAETRREHGAWTHIFHFGDHDPSGMDMSRDIGDRIRLFGGSTFHFTRVCLNMDQIEEFNPPPFWAKEKDSRSPKYIKEFGRDSWELDAMPPRELSRLVDECFESVVDSDLFESVRRQSEQERQELLDFAAKYDAGSDEEE